MTAWRVQQRPCGSAVMAVNDAEVVMRPSGALWLEGERALVVADLHLEKGSAYAARGQMLPPYDTRETLDRLQAEIEALDPRVTVLLGDTLHDGSATTRIAPDDRERIAALARRTTLLWITGNHDPEGSGDLAGETAVEIGLSKLVLRHEPSPGPTPGEAAGHLHPCARVKGTAGSVRRRCFITDGERLILPAFGAYAGGLNVRDRAFAGLFARPPLAVALGKKAHAVRWSDLAGD